VKKSKTFAVEARFWCSHEHEFLDTICTLVLLIGHGVYAATDNTKWCLSSGAPSLRYLSGAFTAGRIPEGTSDRLSATDVLDRIARVADG